MSGLSASFWRRPGNPAPPLLPDSPYVSDEVNSGALLRIVCEEQRARFRTLLLIRDYLAAHSGRSRSALAKEQQSLQDLYDATWAELTCAFAPDFVACAQAFLEESVVQSTTESLF
jgi:hypothetical protein